MESFTSRRNADRFCVNLPGRQKPEGGVRRVFRPAQAEDPTQCRHNRTSLANEHRPDPAQAPVLP